MSKTRKNFSSKFKADLVFEALKDERDINTIETENNIQPNLLRNWKKEFLEKADVVFDDNREENLKVPTKYPPVRWRTLTIKIKIRLKVVILIIVG